MERITVSKELKVLRESLSKELAVLEAMEITSKRIVSDSEKLVGLSNDLKTLLKERSEYIEENKDEIIKSGKEVWREFEIVMGAEKNHETLLKIDKRLKRCLK